MKPAFPLALLHPAAFALGSDLIPSSFSCPTDETSDARLEPFTCNGTSRPNSLPIRARCSLRRPWGTGDKGYGSHGEHQQPWRADHVRAQSVSGHFDQRQDRMAGFPRQHSYPCFTHPWQGCTIRSRPRCCAFLEIRISYETETTRFAGSTSHNGKPKLASDFLK